MMFTGSFRSRLLLGYLFWTLGLVGITHFLGIVLAMHFGNFHMAVHTAMIGAVTMACIVAGVSSLRNGLTPFTTLRSRLSDIRAGRSKRVEGTYPSELQPLVDELNMLLAHRERLVEEALAKAGDLAHGLKTPLAVLFQEADIALAAGHGELAGAIRQEVLRMRRQVEYHLAHTRAAASGATPGARCSVAESAEGLGRTLRRLYAGRGLTIDVAVAGSHFVRGRREDVDEMLGNLLDNACKWATSRIAITSREERGKVVITVDDDGPGIDAALREAVLRRGVRADEAAPGLGLGLAIVRELAGLYGGTILLEASVSGGLRARLELPAG